jgi:SWI/SNF-related matrix-associated actin-dependent regulator 1 of chromatin subfamily A
LAKDEADRDCIEVRINPAREDFRETLTWVRSLPSRKYDGNNKRWLIPMTNDALIPVVEDAEERGIVIDDLTSIAIEERVGDFREAQMLSRATSIDIDLPGITGELFGFQKAGVAFALKRKKALIADQMGLGKTVQSIATTVVSGDLPVIICVPASLKINWQRELSMWAPDTFKKEGAVAIITGKFNDKIASSITSLQSINEAMTQADSDHRIISINKGQMSLVGDGALAARATMLGMRAYHQASLGTMAALGSTQVKAIIVNYDVLESWREWLLELIPVLGVKTLICDEAHRLKSPTAQRTMAVMGAPRNKIVGLAERIERVILLTGTPVVNRPEELWTLIRILGVQKHFGTKEAYERNYANGGIKALQQLNRICRSLFMVRRTKEQVLTDLPPKVYHETPIELTNRKAYDDAEADVAEYVSTRRVQSQNFERECWDAFADLHGMESTVPFEYRTRYHEWGAFLETAKKEAWGEHYAMAARAEALLRWNALKLLAAKGKYEGAIDWIDNFLAEGEESLVVFGWHKEMVQGVANHFKVPYVDGTITGEARQKVIDDFQAGKNRLIVGNIQAMGEGLTLTKASDVAFIEYGWSPKDQDQAEDRCHRIGQNDSVTIHNLVGVDTIEEEILHIIGKKRVIGVAVQDGGDASEELNMLDELNKRLLQRAASRANRNGASAL